MKLKPKDHCHYLRLLACDRVGGIGGCEKAFVLPALALCHGHPQRDLGTGDVVRLIVRSRSIGGAPAVTRTTQ